MGAYMNHIGLGCVYIQRLMKGNKLRVWDKSHNGNIVTVAGGVVKLSRAVDDESLT